MFTAVIMGRRPNVKQFCLDFSVSLSLSLSLCLCHSLYLYLSVCLSVCLSLWLSTSGPHNNPFLIKYTCLSSTYTHMWLMYYLSLTYCKYIRLSYYAYL